jgi:hypothetical protein
LRADGVQLAAKAPRFFTARRRIENHARSHLRMILARAVLVEEKAILADGHLGSRGRPVLTGQVTHYAQQIGNTFRALCLGKRTLNRSNVGD